MDSSPETPKSDVLPELKGTGIDKVIEPISLRHSYEPEGSIDLSSDELSTVSHSLANATNNESK